MDRATEFEDKAIREITGRDPAPRDLAPEPGTVRVAITFEEVETTPHGRVTVGHVDVGQPDECEREADEWMGDDDSSLRAAAVAWDAIKSNGVFTVNGKTYEASECAEWWA